LSCTNRSCSGRSYGVTNDGCGTLGGYAWSENAGWINFAPLGAGGRIDPTTGLFSGRAWSENAGWITFSSAGPNPYRVGTSWRRAVPPGSTDLTVNSAGAGAASLAWTALTGATSYDLVQGGLSLLHSSSGDFQSATQACTARTTGTSFIASGTP